MGWAGWACWLDGVVDWLVRLVGLGWLLGLLVGLFAWLSFGDGFKNKDSLQGSTGIIHIQIGWFGWFGSEIVHIQIHTLYTICF